MKHTVVIPLYNKESYISEAIRSLAFQEKKASELIIVDDCSTDQSLIFLKEALSFFAPQFLQTTVKIIELQENKGLGNACNIGIENAEGELISFLDADDYYAPACLKDADLLMKQESIDVLVLGIVLIPSQCYLPQIQSFEKELVPLTDDLFLIPEIRHTISAPDFIIGVCKNVIIKREFLENVRYETSESLNEEIDFWYRVLKNMKKDLRAALLHKACIEVQEVKSSFPKINYKNWKELKVPVLIKRYRKSSDVYDRQLMGMLSKRWLEYAMQQLPNWRQKLLFMVCHSKTLIKNYQYFRNR
ncbi:glycosyltransferase family 2 protein [Flavobacterium foetidum]|uniref:glycosyltransferase family 2 protein n=1 Tax=Flavobacterium foetidum TaxID=2026681 RepID=UPI001075629E|nr:glycosyltransferase family A protein [Flavobacterium foetidum]KAF2513442.1 glycosyltransferase family 2 protein [Flavobacterium foetidum]